MNFYARTPYKEDDTVYSWFSKILTMNGTSFAEFFNVVFPKKKLNISNLIDISLHYIHELENINLTKEISFLSNLSYLKVFYKDTVSIRSFSQKSLWGDFYICPECINFYLKNDKFLCFKKVNQLPLKKVCTKHNHYLLNRNQLKNFLSDNASNIYETPTSFEVELSIFIENIYKHKKELNHLTMLTLLIDKMTTQESFSSLISHWNQDESQALLKEAPEYSWKYFDL